MSQWYDPALLDKYFELFDQVQAFEIDDDEFSLPDATDEANEGVAAPKPPPKKALAKPKRSSGSIGPSPQPVTAPIGRVSPVDGLLSTESEKGLKKDLIRKSTDGTESEKGLKKELIRKSTDGSTSTPKIPPAIAAKPGKFIPGFSIVGKPVTCLDSPAGSVDVRQKNYKKTGHKAASGQSLYEFMALDVLRGREKISKVYTHMHIPWISESQPPDPSGLPEVLIVNLQIPNKGPQMFRTSSDTDPGTSVVYYFKLRHPVPRGDPAVALSARFFAGNAPGRFKAMSFVDNLNELKFPSFLSSTMTKFNGKPVIIYKTGVFTREGHVYEVDVDVFQFPVLARTALSSTRGSQAHARTRAAFVLQGDTDDELPERLLGCCEVRNLDLDASAYDRFN